MSWSMDGWFKRYGKYVATALLVMLLIYAVNANRLLQTTQQPVGWVRYPYVHVWNFKCYTVEELQEVFTTPDPYDPNVKSQIDDDFIHQAEVAAVAHITKELSDNLTARGYQVFIRTVNPVARIEQWREVKDIGKINPMYQIIIHTKLYIDCQTIFETDKPLSHSPLPIWLGPLLIKIAKAIGIVILAACVGYGIYTLLADWLPSMTVNESYVTTEYYDPATGALIKKVTEYQKQPNPLGTLITNIAWVLTAACFAFAALFAIKWWWGKKP